MLDRKSQILSAIGGLTLTFLTFLPLMAWLVNYTSQHTQLLHSFIVLAFAGAVLIYGQHEKISLTFSYNHSVLLGFLVSYILLGMIYLSKLTVLYIPALIAATYAWCHFLFGSRYNRIITALLVAFSFFLGLIIIFPTIDWPLRILAGDISHQIFEIAGSETRLLLFNESELFAEPTLVLTMDGRPFEVAPECNGFGVLSASTLLSVLLIVYYKPAPFMGFLFLSGSILSAFVLNLIRILIIVYLAPWAGDHYFAMHEVIGISVFWFALMGIWMFAQRFEPKNSETIENIK